jgi:hypothetical protein
VVQLLCRAEAGVVADERVVGACPVRVCVVGGQFWDFKHGQTGVAPNAVELHPILGFACLT